MRALPAVLLGLCLLVACGTPATTPDTAGAPAPPRVSAPATLLPDGTVPWVDEPAAQREFDTPVPPRRTDPDATPCTANRLTG